MAGAPRVPPYTLVPHLAVRELDLGQLLHLRAVLGLELGDAALKVGAALMVNGSAAARTRAPRPSDAPSGGEGAAALSPRTRARSPQPTSIGAHRALERRERVRHRYAHHGRRRVDAALDQGRGPRRIGAACARRLRRGRLRVAPDTETLSRRRPAAKAAAWRPRARSKNRGRALAPYGSDLRDIEGVALDKARRQREANGSEVGPADDGGRVRVAQQARDIAVRGRRRPGAALQRTSSSSTPARGAGRVRRSAGGAPVCYGAAQARSRYTEKVKHVMEAMRRASSMWYEDR